MVTGLAHEESDIDFIIFGLTFTDRKLLTEEIERLGDKFSNDCFIEECQPIPTASVPIIKLVYSYNKLNRN